MKRLLLQLYYLRNFGFSVPDFAEFSEIYECETDRDRRHYFDECFGKTVKNFEEFVNEAYNLCYDDQKDIKMCLVWYRICYPGSVRLLLSEKTLCQLDDLRKRVKVKSIFKPFLKRPK
jgi:hypothetical protein